MTLAADIQAALVGLLDAFERLGIEYYVGGSVASSAHGLPRATLDVDLVASLRPEVVDELAAALEQDYYADAQMMRDSMRQGIAFNLIHLGTMLKIDVFTLSAEPFARQAFARAGEVEVEFERGPGRLRVESAEDVVLHKLRWYELGNHVSERQWLDVLGVLKLQESLEVEYMRLWADRLGLSELLELALQEAGLEG